MEEFYVPGLTYSLQSGASPLAMASGTQGLPTAVAPTQVAAPMDERAALLAQLAGSPAGRSLTQGIDPSVLDTDFLRQLATAAREQGWQERSLDFEKRALDLGTTAKRTAGGYQNYMFTNPQDYFEVYGTIPLSMYSSSYTDKNHPLLSGSILENVASGATTRYLTPTEGATYTLYSPKSGKVLGTASTPQGLAALAQQANALNYSAGRKADWELYQQAPGAEKPEIIGANYYNSDRTTLGKIVSAGLPIVGALAGGPLGAALGAAGAGALEGKSIGDIVKAAALSAAMTYAGGKVLGPGSGAGASTASRAAGQAAADAATRAAGAGLTGALGSTAGSALGSLAGEAAPIIVRGATGALGSTLGAVGGAGVGALTNAAANLQQGARGALQNAQQQTGNLDAPGITVTGATPPGAVVSAPGALTGAVPSLVNPAIPEGFGVEQTVTARPQEPTAPVVPPVVPSLVNPAIPEGFGVEQTVTARPQPARPTPPITVPITTAPPSTLTPQQIAERVPTDQGPQQGDGTSLDDIINYLRAGGLATGLLGDLLGGGGGTGTAGRIPAGLGGALNPVFSAQLPTSNLPGGPATPRPASALPQTEQDWYRYGYGPEQSFFSNVPQGARNTSTAYTGYAQGGYAVGGPGTGRSDEIPALLSDGEYVIDAETVALLGDGSNKAGAQALDRMRKSVRKHKGRNLAKGNFSVKAKAPDQYLKGRG